MDSENISSEVRGQLLNTICSSGFPFQARMAQYLRGLNTFESVLEEQSWKIPLSENSGFIDIVAVDNVLRFIIECKRYRDDSWIFLIPSNQKQNQINKFFWSYNLNNQTSSRSHQENGFPYGWYDFSSCDIDIPLANQCVVKRGKSQEKPIIEDIGANLVDSSEWFGITESKINKSSSHQNIYVPVLVTTARLFTCEYDLSSTDIRSGNMHINDSSPKIEEVPFIRFRKSMGACTNYGSDY